MFAKLFGGGQPKIDPAKQKEIDAKKTAFELVKSKEELNKKIEENDSRMHALEKKVADKKKEALAAKNANQKDKAMRILTEVKNLKDQVTKISGYNTMLMKQQGNLDSVGIDNDMADIFGATVC